MKLFMLRVCRLYRPSWGLVEKKAQRSLVKGRVCVCFIFILLLNVLGLRCCMQVFSNCGELLFFAGHGLFIAGFLLLQSTGFGVRVSSVVAVWGLSCPESWNLPGAGIEPMSPVLAGGLFWYMFNLFIFNWRVSALHCCVGFCYTSTWISHRYTYVPSLLNFHPTLLGCHRAPGWAPCIIEKIPTGYLFYILVYVSMLLSQPVRHPQCAHKSVLYVSILSIAALQID